MKKILITGISGEVGQGLLENLKDKGFEIIGVDLNELPRSLRNSLNKFYKLDITDEAKITKLFENFQFDIVYHLAAMLSTSAERDPGRAHVVNSGGTFNLINCANKSGLNSKKRIKFIFPSTIAVYGMTNMDVKSRFKKVKEDQFLDPITMYGVNKLYCENLGKYYSTHFSQLSDSKRFLDFRVVRFPGLLSAFTLPTGGTSDYAPEIIHAAAANKLYNCFVRPDTTIGFMAMPDAVRSLVELEIVDESSLSTKIYNVAGFSASAKDFENEVRKYYPQAKINYKVDKKRQRIVDSWPMDTDDTQANKDWGWKPEFDLAKTFADYLIPNIS